MKNTWDGNRLFTTEILSNDKVVIMWPSADRFDLYVAPGYKINPESLAYVKLAYSQVSKDGLMDTSSGASIGTGPKSSGISYGIGFKQKFGPQSPYFYAVDYSFGGLGKGTILSPSGNDGYNSKLNFSSLSINIGKTF